MLMRTLLAFCFLIFVSGAPASSSVDGDDSAIDSTSAPTNDSSFSPNCSDLPAVIKVVEVVREIIVFPNVEDAVAYVLLSDGASDSFDDADEDGSDDDDDFSGFRSDRAHSAAKKNKTKPAKKPRKVSPKKQQIALRADTDDKDGSKCVPAAACTSAADCGGGKAHCIGAFVGKCNCNACISGLPCSGDAQCGGYQHACNSTRGICDCIQAHTENGFADLGDALLTFCNHKECASDKDACFGLPCHTGLCACA